MRTTLPISLMYVRRSKINWGFPAYTFQMSQASFQHSLFTDWKINVDGVISPLPLSQFACLALKSFLCVPSLFAHWRVPVDFYFYFPCKFHECHVKNHCFKSFQILLIYVETKNSPLPVTFILYFSSFFIFSYTSFYFF